MPTKSKRRNKKQEKKKFPFKKDIPYKLIAFDVNKFKKIRNQKGITLNHIANYIGCSYPKVWGIEHEKIIPTLQELSLIASCMEVSNPLDLLVTKKGKHSTI